MYRFLCGNLWHIQSVPQLLAWGMQLSPGGISLLKNLLSKPGKPLFSSTSFGTTFALTHLFSWWCCIFIQILESICHKLQWFYTTLCTKMKTKHYTHFLRERALEKVYNYYVNKLLSLKKMSLLMYTLNIQHSEWCQDTEITDIARMLQN